MLACWRRRALALAVVAVVFAAAQLLVVAVIPAAAAVRYGARLFRREWALGALIAAAGRPALPPAPSRDLREIYRRA